MEKLFINEWLIRFVLIALALVAGLLLSKFDTPCQHPSHAVQSPVKVAVKQKELPSSILAGSVQIMGKVVQLPPDAAGNSTTIERTQTASFVAIKPYGHTDIVWGFIPNTCRELPPGTLVTITDYTTNTDGNRLQTDGDKKNHLYEIECPSIKKGAVF